MFVPKISVLPSNVVQTYTSTGLMLLILNFTLVSCLSLNAHAHEYSL